MICVPLLLLACMWPAVWYTVSRSRAGRARWLAGIAAVVASIAGIGVLWWITGVLGMAIRHEPTQFALLLAAVFVGTPLSAYLGAKAGDAALTQVVAVISPGSVERGARRKRGDSELVPSAAPTSRGDEPTPAP